MVKALALFSGGLDSILACKVMMAQGIKVKGVAFVMSFASKDIEGFRVKLRQRAQAIGLELEIVDVSEPFLELMKKPVHGFGKNLNPCIDCKTLFLRKAKQIKEEKGYDVVFTGEVLGQRPMSQRREALNITGRDAGLKGEVLRPLSAKLLDETEVEKKGLVDRTKLLALHGRSRTPQMEMAKHFGVTDYSAPAGGCLLTDPGFAKRLLDLMKYNILDLDNIRLLKYGRHFRIDEHTKVVIGRDEKENDIIEKEIKGGDVLIEGFDFGSPIGLLRGDVQKENILKAAELVVSHSKKRQSNSAEIIFWSQERFVDFITVVALSEGDKEKLRI